LLYIYIIIIFSWVIISVFSLSLSHSLTHSPSLFTNAPQSRLMADTKKRSYAHYTTWAVRLYRYNFTCPGRRPRMRHRRRRRRVALVPAPFIHAIPFPLSRLFTRYLPVPANTPNLHILWYLNRRRSGSGGRPSWYYLYTSIFTDTTARRDAHPKLVDEWCIYYTACSKSPESP